MVDMLDSFRTLRYAVLVLVSFAVVFSIGVFAYIVSGDYFLGDTDLSFTGNGMPRAFPAEVPMPRAEDLTIAQKGFDYLVSYTELGFEPSVLSGEKRKIVRFTNNSTQVVRIVAGAEQSPDLAPRRYWEYELEESGVVEYSAVQASALP